MSAHRRHLPGVLSLALVLLSGCMTPAVLTRASHRAPDGELAFFEQANGSGAVTIRIVDQRPRGVQSFADADASFNGVLFRLSNATKFKAPRVLAVPASGSVYSAAFTAVPSDAANNYHLTVGLFRGVTTPSNPADPGYANVANKAGEGGSIGFSVAPGTTTTVTVKINAVGELYLDSQSIVIDQATPVYLQGETTAQVDTLANALKSPQADGLKVYVLDSAGVATLSTVASPSASWPASPQTASISFPVPTALGNYQLCVEQSTGSLVLSRRYKLFSVEQAATISVNLD